MWKCGCECSQLCLTDYITGESLFVFNPPVKHNKHKTGVEIVPSWYFIGWPFLGIPEKKKRKTQRIRHTRVKVSAQHNTALLVLGFKPGSSPITSLTFHGLSNEKTGLRKVGEESYLYLINKHPQEPLLRLYFSCFFMQQYICLQTTNLLEALDICTVLWHIPGFKDRLQSTKMQYNWAMGFFISQLDMFYLSSLNFPLQQFDQQ